jgi:phosphoglycolate phosphatase-like HAD superfamily hydrolase
MFFDGGIFGSPDTKSEILSREFSTFNIKKPAVFLGDSRYDYETAVKKGLDFIFIHGWSEFDGWEKYFRSKNVYAISNIEQLIKLLK